MVTSLGLGVQVQAALLQCGKKGALCRISQTNPGLHNPASKMFPRMWLVLRDLYQ